MVTLQYGILSGRVSELIMDIAMSDECRSTGKIEQLVLYYDTKDNIAHCTHYGK